MDDEIMTVEEKTEAAHLQAAYDETGLNGTSINWRYWVEQMPTLSAAQAACLMSALEPDKFATLSERPGKDDPSRNIEKARKIQRLAESQSKLMALPKEWVEWAQALSINVHTGFLLAVWELPSRRYSKGDAVIFSDGGTAESDDDHLPWWQKEYDIIMLASNEGNSLKRRNKKTSTRAIADAVALRIESEELRTGMKRTIDGGTIRNTVLKGWKYPPE